MSDTQKLKDSIAEYKKAKEALDDKLNKAEENTRQHRREREEQSSRQT